MSSRTNLKLLLSLFAALALNYAYLHKSAESYSEDMASTATSTSSINTQFSDKVKSQKTNPEKDFTLTQKDNGKVKTTVKVTLSDASDTEGTALLNIDCETCGISSDPFEIVFKTRKEFDEAIADAHNKAKDNLKGKVQHAKDVKNCVVKDDKDEDIAGDIVENKIPDSDVKAKLECFKKQAAMLKGDEKDAYNKNIVDDYLKKNVLAQLDQKLSSPNQMAQMQAKGEIEALKGMNLGSKDLTSQLNLMDQIANTNLMPMALNQQIQEIMMANAMQKMQSQQGLMMAQNAMAQAQQNLKAAQAVKNNPAGIRQAQMDLNNAKQYMTTANAATKFQDQAMTQQIAALDSNYFSLIMGNREAISSSMANFGSFNSDPQLLQAAQMSINSSGQSIQRIVNNDPTMKSAFGNTLSFLTPQNNFSMMGMGSTGFNSSNSFLIDPFNSLNAGVGYSADPSNPLSVPQYLALPTQPQAPRSGKSASAAVSQATTWQ